MVATAWQLTPQAANPSRTREAGLFMTPNDAALTTARSARDDARPLQALNGQVVCASELRTRAP
jgi:hypothetical protein